MHFEQFFVEGLGHQSYLLGSDATREAVVVDPRRDVETYVDAAHAAGLRIRFVLETHNHNDFLSGAKTLAERVGAEHLASAEAGLTFPHRGVREGDELVFGELKIRVLRTPGHTPEHVSYAVYDTARSIDAPLLVFTGGDLLVGAVGRPDLLGRQLGEVLAPQLFDSLHQKILPLGDGTLVMPTHGGGSLCGRGISNTRVSSIGYEKLTNPALQERDRDAFVRFVLDGNPGIPAYYARMRPANQSGAAPFEPPAPTPLPAREVQHLAGHGAAVLDTRQNVAFGAAHVPGAYNVPLDDMFVTWAGWLVPHDVPLILVLDRPPDWERVVAALARIGHERVVGYLDGGMAAWVEQSLPFRSIEQIDVREANRLRAEQPQVQFLDVRTDDEWEEGHVPDAHHAGLGVELPARLDETTLDPSQPVAVICGSGYRSSIATSLLAQRGFERVYNVLGGMTAWREAALPLRKDATVRV